MLEQLKILKTQVKLLVKNLLESIIYFWVRERRLLISPRRVVFVCTGNICRSAFAEKLLKTVMDKEFCAIDSCGLVVEVRSSSPHQAVSAAGKIGLDLSGHLSKGIGNCDVENADLILAMEYWQYRKLLELLPHKRNNIRLLREFTPFPENMLCNIYDPFGLSQRHFERCFAQIHRALIRIRALLQSKDLEKEC